MGLVGAAVSAITPRSRTCAGKILAAGGDYGHQFAAGRLRRRRAVCGSWPRAGCRSVALAPEAGSDRLRKVHEQGPQPGRPGPGRGGRQPGRDSANCASTSWWACPPRPWRTSKKSRAWCGYLEHCVVKDSVGKRRLGLITLSISSFVPKPFTPFQWTPFLDVAELKKRLKLVTREFHGVKEVRVHTDLPKWAYVQALLARGDRRVGDILLAAHQHGWNRAFRESPVNPDFFTLRERAPPRNSSPGTSSTTACRKTTSGKNTSGPWKRRRPRPAGPKMCKRCGVCGGEGV